MLLSPFIADGKAFEQLDNGREGERCASMERPVGCQQATSYYALSQRAVGYGAGVQPGQCRLLSIQACRGKKMACVRIQGGFLSHRVLRLRSG